MNNTEKSIVDLAKEFEASKDPNPQPLSKESSQEKLATGDLGSVLDTLLSKAREKAGWIEVKLPSLGKPYQGVWDSESVRIKPFGFAEERAIRTISSEDQGKDTIDYLFSHCVEGPDPESYTLPDKEFLLFKLRQISYGDTYPVDQKCDSCGKSNKGLKLKISNIPVNYLESWESSMKVTLPDSELEVVYRTPRSSDDTDIVDPINNISKFIKTIGGYGDSIIIKKVLLELSAKDISVLRTKIFDISYGLDKLVFFECIHCKKENSMILPLNEHFFTASLDQDAQ